MKEIYSVVYATIAGKNVFFTSKEAAITARDADAGGSVETHLLIESPEEYHAAKRQDIARKAFLKLSPEEHSALGLTEPPPVTAEFTQKAKPEPPDQPVVICKEKPVDKAAFRGVWKKACPAEMDLARNGLLDAIGHIIEGVKRAKGSGEPLKGKHHRRLAKAYYMLALLVDVSDCVGGIEVELLKNIEELRK